MEPVFLGRPFRTASGFPQFLRQSPDVFVSEFEVAAAGICRGGMMLKSLPRLFVSGQMFLLAMLLAGTMCMRGAVVQFGGTLMVFIMRSVVITSRH